MSRSWMEARLHKRKLLRGGAMHSTVSMGQVGLAFSRRQQCLFKRGDWTIFFFIMKFSFFLLHCVPLYVCRLCINYQDLSANLLGVAALRMLLLTFTSRFVIDFLSIRKVIIFSAIATDDRHPLRSRSIHQNAANCMTIHFRYIAQPRGVRKTYCARSRKWCSTPYQSVERHAE